MIRLSVINNQTEYTYETPVTGKALLKATGMEFPRPVLGARVNNRIRELSSPIYIDSTVEFFDITSSDGFRMIQRGLTFLLYLDVSYTHLKLPTIHPL